MNAALIEIRPLTPADAAAYRDIRLAGLRESPEAFGSTFDRENIQPFAWFRDRLAASRVFGALCSADLLGIAGFAIREGEKERHKGLLWGMYVRPDVRKAGLGRQLVEAVVEYGLERDSLKQNGRYYDEILMALDLRLDLSRYALPEPGAGSILCEELASSTAK